MGVRWVRVSCGVVRVLSELPARPAGAQPNSIQKTSADHRLERLKKSTRRDDLHALEWVQHQQVCVTAHQIGGLARYGCFDEHIVFGITANAQGAGGTYAQAAQRDQRKRALDCVSAEVVLLLDARQDQFGQQFSRAPRGSTAD